MRTILVGIEDLGVRLADRLLSTARQSSSGEGKARLVLETFFVDRSGERERLRASYELDGVFLGEGYRLVENLAPGVHKVRIIPKKVGALYPEVKGELEVEPDDEEVRAVAEVYHYAIPRVRVARWFGPLVYMLIAGMVGLALGALRMAVYDPEFISIYLKFLLMSSVPATVLHFLFFFRRDFQDQPADRDLRLLLAVYLAYVTGLGAAFLMDYLYLTYPYLPLPFSFPLAGMLEEELVVLLLGSYGSLMGLVVWLLREFGAAPEVLALESWTSVKRKLILILLTSMATGGVIAATVTSLLLAPWGLRRLLPSLVIPFISLASGAAAGFVAEYLSRGRRWDLASPLLSAAGVYTITQVTLSYVASYSSLLWLPPSPLEPLTGLNLGSPLAGVVITLLLLRRVEKIREPCLCVLSVRKTAPVAREVGQRPLEVFGMAISHREDILASAWNVSKMEEDLRKFRPGGRLRLRLDPGSDPGGAVRSALTSLVEYVVWRCSHPPDLTILIVDALEWGASLGPIVAEVREVLEVPLISLVIFSSRDPSGLEALRDLGEGSDAVLLVDIERALPLGKTREESVEALLDELATVLGMVINADRGSDPAFRLSASSLGKLLSHPERVDPYGTIGVAMLDPDFCSPEPSPENVADVAATALLNPMADFREEGAWGILLMRGPRECMYVWAAKGELEKRLGRGIVGYSVQPSDDSPLTVVVLISGLELSDIHPFSSRVAEVGG